MATSEPLVTRIAQPRLPDLIAEQIMQVIRSRPLAAGDRLPTEAELARQFGVGRTSVREGLQKLQTLGLVEVVKGRGAFVSEPQVDDAQGAFNRWTAERGFAIEDLIETRIALETAASALAAARATRADLAELAAADAAHRAAAEVDDLPAVFASDERFHRALFDAAHNDLLDSLYELLVAELTDFRRKTLALAGAPARSAAGHATILSGVAAGDASTAREAMLDHLWVLAEEVHEAAGGSRRELAPRAALG
jgi:GntR family transcriptional repressor for pyruvate dehydrogenase complex